MNINERANLVFQDSDIIPLFIQARLLSVGVPCVLRS